MLAVPVVDDQRRLLGIVTIDNLVDVMEQEATRDILSIDGVEPGALDQAYFDNQIGQVMRRRIGWLMLLFVTVGVSLALICTWANAVAALVPIFAQRVGVDPTVLSAPLIATLVDATGLIIYFNVAFLLIARLAEPVVALPARVSEQLLVTAQQAPAEWAARIREIAQPQADRIAHAHEWIFPVIALAILSGVLLAISRHYHRGETTAAIL